MKTQNILITVIAALAVVVILGMYQSRRDAPPESIGESIGEVIDSAKEGGREFREEVKDEIDDHTTSK